MQEYNFFFYQNHFDAVPTCMAELHRSVEGLIFNVHGRDQYNFEQ